MKISVQHKSESNLITVYKKYDDIIVECNHAGAEKEYLPAFTTSLDGYGYVDDGSELVLVCDKCDMQLIDGEWV